MFLEYFLKDISISKDYVIKAINHIDSDSDGRITLGEIFALIKYIAKNKSKE